MEPGQRVFRRVLHRAELEAGFHRARVAPSVEALRLAAVRRPDRELAEAELLELVRLDPVQLRFVAAGRVAGFDDFAPLHALRGTAGVEASRRVVLDELHDPLAEIARVDDL